MAPAQHYIHSYEPGEQDRLLRQGEFLAPWVQPGLDLSGCGTALELGCGVGVQLRVLLRRFPSCHFTGVDVSSPQIFLARRILATPLAEGRVDLLQASAFRLPFPDASFDCVYTVWVLEHLGHHAALLGEACRVLRPGGRLCCTEVFNSGLYTDPPMPGLARWWQAFNALQRELGGDPDVGIRLGALFASAGLEQVELQEVSPQLDGRTRQREARQAFLDFWQDLLLSGAGQLQAHGRVDEGDIAALQADFATLVTHADALFRYTAFQARGRKPC